MPRPKTRDREREVFGNFTVHLAACIRSTPPFPPLPPSHPTTLLFEAFGSSMSLVRAPAALWLARESPTERPLPKARRQAPHISHRQTAPPLNLTSHPLQHDHCTLRTRADAIKSMTWSGNAILNLAASVQDLTGRRS